MDLRPVPVGTPLRRGDLLFEHTRTWAGALIRAGELAQGTLTRVNHVGAVLRVNPDGTAQTAEAYAGAGHTLHTRDLARFNGVVMRAVDPAAAEALAGYLEAHLGLAYDNGSIVWAGIEGIDALGRRFRLLRPLRLLAGWLATVVDDNDDRTRVICSDIVRQAVEFAHRDQVTGLELVPAHRTRPAQLLDALLGRRLPQPDPVG